MRGIWRRGFTSKHSPRCGKNRRYLNWLQSAVGIAAPLPFIYERPQYYEAASIGKRLRQSRIGSIFVGSYEGGSGNFSKLYSLVPYQTSSSAAKTALAFSACFPIAGVFFGAMMSAQGVVIMVSITAVVRKRTLRTCARRRRSNSGSFPQRPH